MVSSLPVTASSSQRCFLWVTLSLALALLSILARVLYSVLSHSGLSLRLSSESGPGPEHLPVFDYIVFSRSYWFAFFVTVLGLSLLSVPSPFVSLGFVVFLPFGASAHTGSDSGSGSGLCSGVGSFFSVVSGSPVPFHALGFALVFGVWVL